MAETSLPPPERRAISSIIEAALDCGAVTEAARLIDLLDDVDGDTDREPCAAGDDGLHYCHFGYCEGWGYWDDPGGVPIYGDDQTQPPMNMRGTFVEGWGA